MKPTTDPMPRGEGVPAAVPDSVSLDLPPAIETLITMPATPVTTSGLGEIATGVGTGNPQYPALDFRMQPMVMQEGGMVPTPPAGFVAMAGSLAFLVTEDSPVIAAPEQAGIFALESSWINWFAPVPTSSNIVTSKVCKVPSDICFP